MTGPHFIVVQLNKLEDGKFPPAGFLAELSKAIFLDWKVICVVRAGQKVPSKLAQIVDRFIEATGDARDEIERILENGIDCLLEADPDSEEPEIVVQDLDDAVAAAERAFGCKAESISAGTGLWINSDYDPWRAYRLFAQFPEIDLIQFVNGYVISSDRVVMVIPPPVE